MYNEHQAIPRMGSPSLVTIPSSWVVTCPCVERQNSDSASVTQPKDPAENRGVLFLIKFFAISLGIWLPLQNFPVSLWATWKGTLPWHLSLALAEMVEWLLLLGDLVTTAKRHWPSTRKPFGDMPSWVLVPYPPNKHAEVSIAAMFYIRWRSPPQPGSALLMLLDKWWNCIKEE